MRELFFIPCHGTERFVGDEIDFRHGTKLVINDKYS